MVPTDESSPSTEQARSSAWRKIDQGLQHRIRSLLESRNTRYPPRTPYPSPDYQYQSVLYDSGTAKRQSVEYDPQNSSEFLASLETLHQEMVATRYDGPANSHEDALTTRVRQSSPESMTTERGPQTSIGPPLNHTAALDLAGGNMKKSSPVKRANSTSSKSDYGNRKPRYAIRVVPPRQSRTTDMQQRPEAHHVPGSYRSERDTNVRDVTEQTNSRGKDDHSGHNHGPLDLQDHLATIVEPSTHAVDDLMKHSVRPLYIPSAGLVVDDATPAQEVQPLHVPSIGVAPDETMSAQEAKSSQGPQAVPSRSSSLHNVQLGAIDSLDSPDAPLLPKDSSSDAHADEPTRASPVSRALSILSEISGRSAPRSGSSISITTSQRRGSAVKPSEIAFAASGPPLSVTNRENRELDRQTSWVQQMAEKRAGARRQLSNLTARSSHPKDLSFRERIQSLSSARLLPNEDDQAKLDLQKRELDELSLLGRQRDMDEPFSKVIGDLENLLREALDIAGKAASRDNSEAFAEPPSDHKRKQYAELRSTETVDDSDSEGSLSIDIAAREDHRPKAASRGIAIVEPAAGDKYWGSYKGVHNATPYPAQSATATRHQSTVAPVEQIDSEVNMDRLNTDYVAVSAQPLVDYRPIADPTSQPEPFKSKDWAYAPRPIQPAPPAPASPPAAQTLLKEGNNLLARNDGMRGQQRRPMVHARVSSRKLQGRRAPKQEELNLPDNVASSGGSDSDGLPYVVDFKESARQYHPIILEALAGDTKEVSAIGPLPFRPRQDTLISLQAKEALTQLTPRQDRSGQTSDKRDYDLKDKHHFTIREPHGFSLSRSHRRKPIARDWSIGRKRFVATVTCITTALMGLVLGIYAGEVPALQYALADEHHYTILGNVVFFLGLAITTIFLWPLPLLHGRKPYTLAALALLLPLQFPQALAVNGQRSPYVASYRVGVLLPRAISGLIMGLANINFMTTLLDLFGASLQSGNPHQEIVNENDVRRHGGGIGAWLGIWTWCSIMSIGIGFLIGAGVISGLNVSWGFWIAIILNVAVLLLNVMVPEVRRSPYRRSMAEVRTGTELSRRVARGEIKMHLYSTGPKYWYEEVQAGYVLAVRMLKQPGFFVLALYQGWIYGQIVMVIAVSSKGRLFKM